MEPKRNAEAVKAALFNDLRRSEPVFSAVWKHKSMRAAVREYVQGATDWKDLLQEALDLLALHDTIEAEERTKRRSASPQVTHMKGSENPADHHRARVYSKQLGRLAHRHVSGFRTGVLENQILTSSQAYEFLHSPALAVLEYKSLRSAEASAVRHSASIESQTIRQDPDGSRHYTAEIRISWDERSAVLRRWLRYDEPPPANPFKEIPYTQALDIRQKTWRVTVWPDSVLDKLGKLSSSLADALPWSPGSAAWFVLTGEAPLIPAITVRWTNRSASALHEFHYGYLPIRIEAQPWVDEKTIVDLFRVAKDNLGLKGKRSISEKVLDVYDFVMERRIEDPTLTLAELRREWNRRNRQHHYASDRGFRSAYKNCERMLVHPEGPTPMPLEELLQSLADRPGE